MGDYSIKKAQSGNMTDNVEDWEVTARNTDGITNQEETEWLNSNFTKYFGYYKTVPELKLAVDTRAIWTIGDGYTADPETTVILDHISGWGNDTFDSILENAVVIKRINGDFFAEIIRDSDTGELINLKPLDPATIKIIVDKKGIIKRYEQIDKTNKKPLVKFKPSEIFHLTNKRVADEIHGVSDIEAVEEIIKANWESFFDMKKLMHRHVKPIMGFKLDTDDTTTIDEFATKMDAIINKGENLYVPKGSAEFELISVPSNATLNPMPWREHLKNYFFQTFGIPQIIMGSSGEFTESTAKIAYLAFEQSVKAEQREIITQVWEQLNFRIDLAFPASLKNELLSDEAKDNTMGGTMTGQLNVQPNEVTAGVGR
jgi:hypothetical protein